MADLDVVHEHVDGYTHQGHSVSYTDAYIKINRSFHLKALRSLKGAPLSVFMEIALAPQPPTVQTICADTGYGTHSVCAALDMLVKRNFVDELPDRGSHGAKAYRARSFTWIGSDRNAPPDVEGLPEAPPGDKSPPPVSSASSIAPRATLSIANRNPAHDDDDVHIHNHKESTSSIHARKKRLRAAGCKGINVHLFAEEMSDAQALAWAIWCEENPDHLRNPWGAAYVELQRDKKALPPEARSPVEKKRQPHFQGIFADKVIDTWRGAEEEEEHEPE